MINLTNREREKFSEYLIQEAETTNLLIKEAKVLPGEPIKELLAKLDRTALAMRIVATYLEDGGV